MRSPQVASEALPWALMKLLFDENLSPKLVANCADTFPACAHVSLIGLEGHPDSEIWDYARENEFTIVSKDSDFYHRSVLIGLPPQLVWLRLGNCTSDEIVKLLQRNQHQIAELFESKTTAVLVLA